MYNAYEGVSPMIFPSAPKPVRVFFRINRATCQEWLGRIRGYLVTIGNHTGMPAMAVRNGFEALTELKQKTMVSLRMWACLTACVQVWLGCGRWVWQLGVAGSVTVLMDSFVLTPSAFVSYRSTDCALL